MITTQNCVDENRDFIIRANEKKISIISKQFILDCLENRSLLDETAYLLHPQKKAAEMEDLVEEDGEKSDQKEEKKEEKKEAKIQKQVEAGKEEKESQIEGKWKNARIFISSTFRDMHGERDYLTRYVFPELQDRFLVGFLGMV